MSGAISIHLANEYADYETDRRTRRTLFSGGSGALPEMGLKRGGALVLAWVWLVIALLVAAAGLIGGFLRIAPLIILGLGVFLGWMYSLSPFKLAWRGWGEALNAFLGGMLLPLYGAAVISGHIDGSIPIVTVPFALLTFNNLLATTYADRRSDHAAGKYTLATRMRRGQLRLVYASTSILAFVVLLGMPAKLLPDIAKTISLSAIPMVIWGWLTYTRIHNPLPSVSAMTVLLLAQISGFLLDINPSAAF